MEGLAKVAYSIPKIKMPELNIKQQDTLFPKLQGSHNPPKLTSDSQPKLDINSVELPKLPEMRANGKNPLFSTEMKTTNPYQKN